MEQLNLVNHGDHIAKQAFRMLLNDATPLPMARLAEHVGVDQLLVKRALDDLKHVGRAEISGDSLLGIYGLTLKPTQHRLKLCGSGYFTWCAFDIVGIPAALGESAEITSACAGCQSELNLAITNGEPPHLPIVISWLSQQCDSIRDQFCPTVNFYCNRGHYEAALAVGHAPDAVMSLERAAEMGRQNWGWAR